ncbi:MAG: peptide ABC transporter substrate-binding protein [Anaerolineae bacterium]
MSRIRRWPVLIALAGLILLGVIIFGLISRQPTVEVPDVGGTFTEAVVGRARVLSPLFAQTDTEKDLVYLLFRGLTRADVSGATVPDVATGWTISPDKLIYTFTLRNDVFWSDGAPVTAEDVLFTIKTLQDPAFSGDPDMAILWHNIAVEVVDDHTVRFILPEPYAPFLDQTAVGLLPAHVLKDVPVAQMAAHSFSTQPVGNGPFKIEKLDDTSANLVPNPYDGGRRPYLSRLIFRFFPDRSSALAAFNRKEVMGVGQVAPADLAKLSSGAIYSAARPIFTAIYLDLHNPLFQDRAVRQALLMGLDREALVRHALYGQALVTDSPIITNSWAYNPELHRYTYNVDQARALLDNAGWRDTNGDGIRDRDGRAFEFKLTTADEPSRVAVANMIAKQWEQLGVHAKVSVVAPDEFQNNYLEPRNFDAILYGWNTPDSDPDPYAQWHSTQIKDGQNYSGWSNKDADRILEEARHTTDPAARAGLYRDFQALFAQDLPALLLYHGIYEYAVDSQVRNVQVGSVLLDPHDRLQTVQQWYMHTRPSDTGLLSFFTNQR